MTRLSNRLEFPRQLRAPLTAVSRLHVDSASATSRSAMAVMQAWPLQDHVLFGTDYPLRTSDRLLESLENVTLAPDLLAAAS